MITILISGSLQPKTKHTIAMHFAKKLKEWGFVTFQVYTTDAPIPGELLKDATMEDAD